MKINVLIWGATPSIKPDFEDISKQYNVIGFIDSNSEKWGKQLFGVEIHPPEMISEFNYELIFIISISGKNAILKTLEDFKVEKNKINTQYVDFKVVHRVNFIKNLSQHFANQNITGYVAEVGVFQGEFAQYLNEYFKDSLLYLFDTFEGFSKNDINIELEKSYSNAQMNHLNNTSKDLVMNKMLYKENVRIHEGYFPETALEVKDEFIFGNLDLDLYKPTYEGLKLFYDMLVPGGIILIHDYFNDEYKGVKEAVSQFVNERQEHINLFPIGDLCSIGIVKGSN